MHQFYRSRTARLATAALGGLLLIRGAAQAQSVQIFDEAPSIEQLRSIMIPESRPGLSRSIVLQRPDVRTGTNIVQAAMAQPVEPPVVTQAVQAQSAPAVAGPLPGAAMPARMTQAAASPAPRPAPQNTAGDAGIVGFRINFALDSATLPRAAYVFIDRMAELMQQEPQVRLRVEGHTDALGTAAYNQDLSERRAAAVANYLVQHGIAAGRLVIEGKGMTEPMTKDPYDGQNRRVQFVRLG